MHYQKHKHTCLPSQESGVCYCPVLVKVSPKDKFRKFLLSQHWHYYRLFSNHEATFPVLTHFFCVPPEQHKGLRLSASGSPTVLLQQTESNFSAVIMNFNLIIRRITMWWRCTRIIAAAALVHYHHQHIQILSQLQLKWRLTRRQNFLDINTRRNCLNPGFQCWLYADKTYFHELSNHLTFAKQLSDQLLKF